MKLSMGVIFAVLIAASFVTMMHVKNGVKDMRLESHSLAQERGKLLESVKVLEAERAYLSRPERLEIYAASAGLQEVLPRQVVQLPQVLRASYGEAR